MESLHNQRRDELARAAFPSRGDDLCCMYGNLDWPGRHLRSAFLSIDVALTVCLFVLVLQGCATSRGSRDSSETPLMRAAAAGNTAEVERLLGSGANARAVDQHRRTALMYACSSAEDSPALVDALLVAGSDVNATDQWGRTPLHLAVDTLGAAFGSASENVRQETPRHKAVLRRLIAAHPDANVIDSRGFTPLMLAAAFTDPETIQILMSAGSDVNFRSPDGNTAVSIAKARGNTAIVQALRAAGARE